MHQMSHEMPNEIIKEIDKFSLKDDSDGMDSYLEKKLKNKEISAQQILNYTNAYWKNSGKYIISEEVINSLGCELWKLGDKDSKISASKFFKIAADRGSSQAMENYAEYFLEWSQDCGVQRSPSQALTYAKKAVGENGENHQHKFFLFKAQLANEQCQEANETLLSYLTFVDSQSDKDKLRKEVKDFTYKVVIEEFKNNFKHNINNIAYVQSQLKLINELSKSLEKIFSAPEIQDIYFIKANYHKQLKELPQAMLSYCAVKDEKSTFYPESISARAELLKECVRELVLKVKHPFQSHPAVRKFESDVKNYWYAESKMIDAIDETDHSNRKKEYEDAITQCIDDMQGKNSSDEHYYLCELEDEYNFFLSSGRSRLRRARSEAHFFNPNRSQKRQELITLTHALIDQRFRIKTAPPPPAIDLSGKSTRLLITAERLFQEATLALTGANNSVILGIPRFREKPWQKDGKSGTTGYGPVENYSVGRQKTAKVEHRTTPKSQQRRGDSFFPDDGTYDGKIFPFLNKLCEGNAQNEKEMAKLMIAYGRTQNTVSLPQLQNLNQNATDDDVDKFNEICFLILAKEQSQWHCATNNYLQGMSVSQARCLIMLEAGFLRLEEIFKNNVLFGVYSSTEILKYPSKVKEVSERIDKLYVKYLQSKTPHLEAHIAFFKNNMDKSPMVNITTRKQCQQDLRYIYGGESDTDTDDSGYDTDLSM